MVELPAAAVKEHLWNICGNAAVSQTMPWNSDWQAVCDVCGWKCKTPLFKKKAFKDSVVMVCGWNFEVICCVCLLEGKAEAGLQHSWRYTRDEAFKVRSENCEPPMCTNWVGAVYDRLPPSSQASSAWTSTSPPPPWLSPPPLPPEEVLKDILDELTGAQGRVNKIEMMIIKLLNQKNESKETIKHKETVFEHR